MKLRLSPRAEDDLDRIAAYLEPRDPQAARIVQQGIAAALRLLTEHAQSGRHIGRGARRFAVPRQPYLILYRIDARAGEVAVATIRHTSRRPLARSNGYARVSTSAQDLADQLTSSKPPGASASFTTSLAV